MGKVSRWMKGLFGAKKHREIADKKSQKKEKTRWFVVGSRKESGLLAQIPGDASDWRRTHIADSEKEQSRHAIAVAAATAAAADAAVAAANAAVEVVRLTSRGRGGMFFAGGRETLAATRIQAVFRGHLARKALRALKGLVKLQAMFRGYLVRKRAAATLHSIQALMRVQTALQSQRARRSLSNNNNEQQQSYPKTKTRKSIERLEGTRSEFHSKRLSSTFDPSLCAFDEIPKIVEIDTCSRLRSGSRRHVNCMSEYCDHQYYRTEASPLPYSLHSTDLDSRFAEEDYRFATAHNTPRFGCSSWAPTTPAKSVCGDSFFKSYSNCPGYMANTQSFSSKVRSHSAPKQRPGSGIKKRLSLDELMSSRASFGGSGRMRRPLPRAEEEFES